MPSRTQSGRYVLALLLTISAVALGYTAHVVSRHTIAVVNARHLLPRWDLATHLVHGWTDYHLLATGQIHRLLWDLWLQGYWPPALSIYQIPFYLVLGGGLGGGLWSSLIAFTLVGIAGTLVLWRIWRLDAVLPASVFLALLISSPYLLAYGSVTMTETFGALVQLLVLLSYVWYRQNPGPAAARLFAASLTLLFFTKYNYFFLLAAPLVIHESLDRSHESLDRSPKQFAAKPGGLWRWTRRAVSSPTVVFIVLYLVAVLIIMRTGGFDVRLFGRRISVHGIGNSGHIVLYLLLMRLWYLHRHGRIRWDQLLSADPRVRPLLIWFVVPVTIWLAAPYPNHIRDFANLVINRPLGESTVGAGAAIYFDALRTTYFYSEWILWLVVVVFAVAAARYRRQPPLMQWLILAIPLQLAAIAFHQTRFPRFLLLTVVLLCLAAASELGRWFVGPRTRIASSLLGMIVLGGGVLALPHVVSEDRFREVAFENYTDNDTLWTALESIRTELAEHDLLAIVGQGNELSPALFRWELGPPSGVPSFPYELGGARGLDLARATKVLLMLPLDERAEPLDLTSYYLAQRQAVLDSASGGELVLRREIPIADLHVLFRLYERRAAVRMAASGQ